MNKTVKYEVNSKVWVTVAETSPLGGVGIEVLLRMW